MSWSMAAILRDSVVVVVHTRPRAIPLAMITTRKPIISWVSFAFLYGVYGASLGDEGVKKETHADFSFTQKKEGINIKT